MICLYLDLFDNLSRQEANLVIIFLELAEGSLSEAAVPLITIRCEGEVSSLLVCLLTYPTEHGLSAVL